jgi:hypothetical protein
MVNQQRIKALKKEEFPVHPFFDHLQRGSTFYQNRDFERASEEWSAAGRMPYSEVVALKRLDDKICCGVQLEEIPFINFFYSVYTNKMDGVGVVRSEGKARKILFNNGRIVRAGTTRSEERIGQFILKKQDFSEADLERFADDAKDAGMRLGQFMMEKGYLTMRDLQEVLALQVEEILGDVLTWRSGLFYVIEGTVKQEVGVSYTPMRFAMSLARRGFHFADFRNRIPSNKTIFRPSPYIEEKRDNAIKSLSVNEQFIFSLIDGTRNIEQLILFSGADEVSVINILYKLSSLGLLRRTKEVIEYEDSEFIEVSKILEVLFEVYRIITSELFHELGKGGLKVIQDSRDKLSSRYKVIFDGIDLESPEEMTTGAILRNMYRNFPSPEQRLLFIEGFSALFQNILEELRAFLGVGLRRSTAEKVRKKISDIERFASDSQLKDRLLDVLDTISK